MKLNGPRATLGSSPRVRGKLGDLVVGDPAYRLIPARAGKTMFAALTARRLWAHPRACGENFTLTVQTRRPVGSSPRVRGKHQARNHVLERAGLIPARAGKT